MKNLGQQIRMIRLQKDLGITEFAEALGVSTGYLSNLENGKTETIQLSLLERLISEFSIVLSNDHEDENSDTHIRILRIHQLLKQLANSSPNAAEYLMSMIEQGAELFLKQSTTK